jgi:hypothetical protein
MMPMMKKEMNKRGQFFVIFAVLLGVIILIGATQINKINSKNSFDSFNLKCENYKNEIFEISKYAAINNKDQEFSFLDQFSKNFFNYANQSYKTEMFYLYGNESSFIISNLFEEDLNAKNEDQVISVITSGSSGIFSGSAINITLNKINKEYSFNKDNNFYFLIKVEKDGDVYVCE